MKKLFAALLFLSLPFSVARAADRVLDFSAGCKPYILRGKAWVATKPAPLEGLAIQEKQILRDETFTVIKLSSGTYGVNQKCVITADAPPKRVRTRRSAAPPPVRGDLKSPWSAVFSLGYNLKPSASKVVTDYGTENAPAAVKYSDSLVFLGEANYRINAAFRVAGELGLSQLQISNQIGNETSFFDVRPEYIFQATPKLEVYVGPVLGLFFFSQNRETQQSGNALGDTITLKQQTASTSLLGFVIGADYMLNPQFDLGFFARYFKPGEMKFTGTNDTNSSPYESKLSVSYLTMGLRFGIHF
jgi:hypothetical protein